MAAPEQIAGEFENWLNDRLDSLEVDREVYCSYILGVLQEEENDDEKKDALQGILSAFLEDDTLEEVCHQILQHWTEYINAHSNYGHILRYEVQAIASLIEKQAQIVVKQKDVSEKPKKGKEALLAQYANITDEEEYPLNVDILHCVVSALFKNTNVAEVLNRRKHQREQAKEDAQKKKEQDKMQHREKTLARKRKKCVTIKHLQKCVNV
ncbi:Coiled-coil domain-containing protein 43 [Triplophysa tibetana]|uniref:Coiled-coil domain-containing protein 43 n=1 Tax=Triplophysa tibetana TaxID=1572043 RepID=A0A5A9N9J8_9TELE|nr:Coiled-coil domain-containing protein 43 [Triplophysa tibetana]